MTKLQLAGLLGLASQLAHAYPSSDRPLGAFKLSDLVKREDNEFYFAAIGDSWGSGVAYMFHYYDDNTSGCQRLKEGWATVIRDLGKEWGPEGYEPKLCFEACSGRKMEHMSEELDKCADFRPEITIMEVSGNDADFYGMADNCLFHKWGKNYGTLYEDDDPANPTGSCRQSIAQVRENIKGIESKYKDTINMWKGHRANQDNDASLFTIGYGQFFGMNDECNDWNFQVPIPFVGTQRIVKEMREEFNEMVGLVNSAIKSATESFNDPKIQYIDINPAFNEHRFCEPGHSKWDQLNYGSLVWIWNQPTKYWLQLKKGDEELFSWDARGDNNPEPPESTQDLNGFDQYNADDNEQNGDEITAKLYNKDKPDQVLLVTFSPNTEVNVGDSVARTLHPTNNGHASMGVLIEGVLKGIDWPPPNQDLPPLPPVNNKALSIIMEQDGDSFKWVFYETNRGERAGCDTDKTAVFLGPPFSGVDINDPPPPQGDYDMTVWGRPCKYHGDGSNRGELICDDEHIACQAPSPDAPTVDCPDTGRKQHEGAFCEFFTEESTDTQPADPPPPPPAPAGPTKAMTILLEEYAHGTGETTMEWLFFATEYGASATCYAAGQNSLINPVDGPKDLGGDLAQIDNPPNPAGVFKLNAHGEDCEYRNDNTNPGGLFCGDKKYDCQDAPERGGGEDASIACQGGMGLEEQWHHPVISCQW